MSNPSIRPQLEQQLDTIIQRWGNVNVLFTHCIASQIGLSATEFECLCLIKDEGPITAGQLSRQTGLTTGAITGLIDRLEKAGLAQRQPDPADRRRVMVRISQNTAAKAKIRGLYEPVGVAYKDIIKDYSDAELQLIAGFITQYVHSTDHIAAQMRAKHSEPQKGNAALPGYRG